MNCYDCDYSQILEIPKNYPKNGYSIFGYCHKNRGNYPIYVPESKCKEHRGKGLELKYIAKNNKKKEHQISLFD